MKPRKVSRKRLGPGWEVRYTVGGQKRSKTFDLKADAEDFGAEVRRRLGTLADLDAGHELLGEYVVEWHRVHAVPNLAASTRNRYAQVWDSHIRGRLGTSSYARSPRRQWGGSERNSRVRGSAPRPSARACSCSSRSWAWRRRRGDREEPGQGREEATPRLALGAPARARDRRGGPLTHGPHLGHARLHARLRRPTSGRAARLDLE
jgi:hypothetical protein